MRRLETLVTLLATTITLASPTLAQQAAPPTSSPAPAQAIDLQTVMVSGEQPGPGLWKVSKGDHVLWVLGTLDVLPKKMQWQAREVQQHIGEAQQVLAAPTVTMHADMGFFGELALLPSLVRVRNNPDGKKLSDVVPAADYARWLVLKAKYIGHDNGVEKQRPIFAAIALYFAAIKRAGLSGEVIDPLLKRAMKQHKLKPTAVNYTIEVADPRALVTDFKREQVDDLDCFDKTLRYLEGDVALRRARANAWALGDLDQLRKLPMSDQLSVCQAAIIESGIARKLGVVDLRSRFEDTWVSAADKALDANRVSFALLPMPALLPADNYLLRLQAQGDTVELPDGLTPPDAAPPASSTR